ncbi:hypothetical protein CASFOL_038245 [Castilleja foliolosa]|uniref:RNase H type-1 domain-containing protein n=1 Tax=Castilleja foliolosa TaxID=1961234 RepID=A0ABD3BKX8_9LAMI
MSPDVHVHHVVRERNAVAEKLAAKARSNLRLGESRVYEEDDTEHMDAENLSLIQDDRVKTSTMRTGVSSLQSLLT